MHDTTSQNPPNWLDKPLFGAFKINAEVAIFVVIILLTVFSRFYDLGTRVMSHDESLHTYYSWKLYKGEGYQHTPMMHGPFQFHALALTYFLFGDSDFTARIPHALASILTVIFLWNYRRYLGRAGALIAAALWMVSPYMLYYGRYARNEAFVALSGLVMLWAVLRYLETGAPRYMYWITAALVLHFCSKETSFIYTAQILLFLGFFFLNRILRQDWQHRLPFLISLVVSALSFGLGIGVLIAEKHGAAPVAGQTAAPAVPGATSAAAASVISTPVLLILGVGVAALLVALFFLLRGYTMQRLREERSFNVMVMVFTLIMPHLVAFPVAMAGWVPTDYSQQGLTNTAIFLVPITLIAVAVGLWWNWEMWLRNAAIFYGVFVLLYTTLFTNGGGFFTGLVGSLGYWIEQQGVQRGSHPWYYYLLIQVPIYEYLPLLGSIVAAILYFGRKPEQKEKAKNAAQVQTASEEQALAEVNTSLAIPLLLFWAVTSLAAYSYAGEKMPWLTVHVAFGLILLAGWALGVLIEGMNWSAWKEQHGWLTLVVMLVFLISLPMVFISLLGPNRPFQGKELLQLQYTSQFMLALLTVLVSGWGLLRLLGKWTLDDFVRLLALVVFGLLGVLTLRTSIMANYINYDQANEYLVYAHSARGVKDVMKQVEELSLRTTDGLAMVVAYDDDTSWPMTWYMRNYPNQRYYGNAPGKDLRDATAIIVGDNNYSKVEPVVGKAFHRFDYIRMIWPNQDYFNLDLARIQNALVGPMLRSAIFDIWLNRDFSQYGIATNQDMAINNWNPSDRMRLYVRKDVAAKIWEYGAAAVAEESVADPYEKGHIKLNADMAIGVNGKEAGQFQAPRVVAIAADGSLYVADSGNHRIQHLSPDGKPIQTWGSFGEGANAAPGTFNEPWGIALAPDGSVLVSDTWNHRIQKFSATGEFISQWGHFGQAETHDAFWGPRSIVVDAKERVFIADTGNKRIAVFDLNGNYITEFGGYGLEVGKFDEPVGLAIDSKGNVYVADTWNQRVQSFLEQPQNVFNPMQQWDVSAWYGQSLDNKPFLTITEKDHVLASDPEGYRILEFTTAGQFVRAWGDYSSGMDGFGVVNGLTADRKGGVWVCDSSNHRLLHFTLP